MNREIYERMCREFDDGGLDERADGSSLDDLFDEAIRRGDEDRARLVDERRCQLFHGNGGGTVHGALMRLCVFGRADYSR